MIDKSWPTKEAIDEQNTQSFINREWTRFDFSNCQHERNTIAYAGKWEIALCNDCGSFIYKVCTHEMIWNDAGTLLRCNICGIDGT